MLFRKIIDRILLYEPKKSSRFTVYPSEKSRLVCSKKRSQTSMLNVATSYALRSPVWNSIWESRLSETPPLLAELSEHSFSFTVVKTEIAGALRMESSTFFFRCFKCWIEPQHMSKRSHMALPKIQGCYDVC